MATDTRRAWSDAARDAEAFRARIPKQLYLRWEIGGSVRRNKPQVGDVEHVTIPVILPDEDPFSLYPNDIPTNQLFKFLDKMMVDEPENWQKHNYNYDGRDGGRPVFRWGPCYRGIDYNGFNHELFLADASNWGLQLWLRTGSADFNIRVVEHINKQTRLQLRDGYLRYRDSGAILQCPEEETFFAHIGLPFVPPDKREK